MTDGRWQIANGVGGWWYTARQCGAAVRRQ
jgi:hypothetical protein